jgi:hypothetical protein
MTTKSTIGKAIDEALAALSSLDKREQQVAIATVCSLLDINPGPTPPSPSRGDKPAPPSGASNAEAAAGAVQERTPPPAQHGLDIRTLKEQKQPDSARQMACVAAFYLQEHAPDGEKKTTVNTADLERYFKQAGFPLPAKLAQILPDAKTAGYFEVSSRGEYKMTRVGYNLVAHSLPKSSKA